MFGKFIIHCPICNITWEFEGYEISLEPYPRATCPQCHTWLAAF